MAGDFIPAEGTALRQLLHTLEAQGVARQDIFVVSPFLSVVRALRTQFRDLDIGTVHTMQGKESDVVVLVLGGNPTRPGAKGWAARRPNLLNVAVSRARRRLYVIGDHGRWQTQPFFAVLAVNLPVETFRGAEISAGAAH